MSKRIVEDSKVSTVWECEKCSYEVEVEYVDFFRDNRTPLCCGSDMSYKHTYIEELCITVEDEDE